MEWAKTAQVTSARVKVMTRLQSVVCWSQESLHNPVPSENAKIEKAICTSFCKSSYGDAALNHTISIADNSYWNKKCLFNSENWHRKQKVMLRARFMSVARYGKMMTTYLQVLLTVVPPIFGSNAMCLSYHVVIVCTGKRYLSCNFALRKNYSIVCQLQDLTTISARFRKRKLKVITKKSFLLRQLGVIQHNGSSLSTSFPVFTLFWFGN